MIEIAASERGDTTFSRGIAAQVATVRGWWAEKSLGEERSFTVAAPEKLHDVYDLRKFLDEQRPEDAAYDDALVVYVTGHGVSRPSDDHFLLLRDSDEERLPATAFQTADLITRVLDSDADHVLVMVDSCFSGVLRRDLLRRLQALSDTRLRLKSLVVISSANEKGTPHPEQFTRFLEGVVAHYKKEETGFAASHLSFEEFFEVMTSLYREGVAPKVQFLWPEDSLPSRKDHRQPSPCLPNPGYKPRPVLVDEARSALAWDADLDSYWLSRVSGRPSGAGGPGWYFTGRPSQVRRMIEFLGGDRGTLVVTGEAGSGKSALLARVVTLSDPTFRSEERYRSFIEAIPPDLLVPQGAVDAAVLARNADADELAAALYTALAGNPPIEAGRISPRDQLLDYVLATVRRQGRPLTIVVDGIDEAKNPVRIVTDLIRMLADQRTDDGQPAVRMLLGIRSAHADVSGRLRPSQDRASDLLNLLVRSTDADEPLRTDTGTEQDITAYVSTLLRTLFDGSGSSARPGARRLEKLAAAVAEEVAPSFLDARLAAEALYARGRLPDPQDLEWRRTLREGTQELLRQDLETIQRNTGLPAEHVVQVLRATAFAQGAGLPWAEVWPCAVQALAGGDISAPETVIRQARESLLAGYLTTGVEDGRFVYRPIHERISEVLRENPHLLISGEAAPSTPEASAATATKAHRQLALAFSALQKPKDGPPHPYLRHHLIQHAAAGGVLNDQVVTEKFLPYETNGNVRGALGLLSEHAVDTTRLFAWARIEPFLADAPPLARAESLSFSLWEPEAAAPLSARDAGSSAVERLVPRWKDLAVPGNVLAREDAEVCSLVSFTLQDGTVLIAVGGADGTVRVWDPSTVTPVGTPISGHGPFARALAVVPGLQGEILLAVGCDSGAWTCDPLTGQDAQLPVTACVYDMASFNDPDGTVRLAIGTSDGLVLWDPLTGSVLVDDAAGEDALECRVDALAALTLPGDRPLLAVHRAETVEILDGTSLERVCTVPISGEQVSALALLDRWDGSPVLAVATRASGTVRFWDALTGAERRHCTIRQSAVVLAPYLRWGSGPLLALGTDDGGVQLWDPETGEEAYRFPTDHTSTVTGLAVVPGLDGVPVLVSGSRDRTVRVWNPTAWARRAVRLSPPADGTLLAVIPGGPGPAELISVGSDRNLVVRSADTGRSVRSIDLPYTGFDGPVTALATHTAPDGSVTVAVGLPDGTIGCWSGAWRLMDAWTSEGDHATAFTTFADGSRTVLAVGTSRGAVAYCDLATGEVLGWLHGHGDADGPVHALAYLPLSSGGVLAVASDQGVLLCRPFRTPHAEWPGQIGPVRSLAFCPGDEEGEWYLAVGGGDGSVRLWAPETLEQEPFILSTLHSGPVSALAIVQQPACRPLLASAGLSDTTVRLWDFHTGEEVLRLVTATSLTSLSVLPPYDTRDMEQPVIAFGGPAGTAVATLRLPQSEGQPAGQGGRR
ncbi:NACHT and WD repeat domain-containing protein [Streptomyces sp. NPDC004074]|uniref:NACHT and WD repeat domain-containing protein n=1 Tax=Streptomyces sp. NPDC004074 TaxID=3154277 RepID=UPI0033A93CD6